jgi:hypothetical protein
LHKTLEQSHVLAWLGSKALSGQQLLEVGLIQQKDKSVLLFEQTIRLVVLENLIHALPSRSDELGRTLLVANEGRS